MVSILQTWFGVLDMAWVGYYEPGFKQKLSNVIQIYLPQIWQAKYKRLVSFSSRLNKITAKIITCPNFGNQILVINQSDPDIIYVRFDYPIQQDTV